MLPVAGSGRRAFYKLRGIQLRFLGFFEKVQTLAGQGMPLTSPRFDPCLL